MKELYILLKEHYIKNTRDIENYFYRPFICNNIENLGDLSLITPEQKKQLYNHFKTQFPSKTVHSEFYKHPLFSGNCSVGVWFKHSQHPKDGVQIRIDFLDKIISTL